MIWTASEPRRGMCCESLADVWKGVGGLRLAQRSAVARSQVFWRQVRLALEDQAVRIHKALILGAPPKPCCCSTAGMSSGTGVVGAELVA
jgi:hypothetical protein